MEYQKLDTNKIDRELFILFKSVKRGFKDPLFLKYKSRFLKERRESIIAFEEARNNERLSLGKKLEILCTYGDFKLTKVKLGK